jgi:hypothetical protein
LRRLLRFALLLWIGRWVAGEAAAYLGRNPRRPSPNPLQSAHSPGWMSGPPEHGPERGIEDR